VTHGVEAARLGFAPYYNAVPELSVVYIYEFALILIFFGIMLQLRFATQLAAK